MSIEFHSVYKHYFQREQSSQSTIFAVPAVRGINITIPLKSTSLIMGPSGSGKTTLLGLISSNLQTTSGVVIVENMEIGKLEENDLNIYLWKYIGYLKQNLSENFIEDFSFNEMVSFFETNPLYSETEVKSKSEILKYTELLNLSPLHLDLTYKLMSGGEKQRIGLLFLIFKNPSILLLDEPTSFLDEMNKLNVVKLLQELKKDKKTIVITSHDQIFNTIADEIYFLKEGTIESKNVLQVLPELISGSMLLPGIMAENRMGVSIPHLVLKIFQSEKIIKFDISSDKLKVDFTLITKIRFYSSNINELYYHDNDILDLTQFFDEKLLNSSQYDMNPLWEISQNKISLLIKPGEKS